MAASAVLDYISSNAYPESESVSSATFSNSDLASLLASLRTEQEATQSEIRNLSKSTAGDIDSWIAQAKTLQADILRSRETARQIVSDAEVGRTLKESSAEKRRKVVLLEQEVLFNETLAGTLEHIKYANGLLEKTQDLAVHANIPDSLQKLEDAEASILGLGSLSTSTQPSRAVEILNERKDLLKANLVETCKEFWDDFIRIDANERKLSIRKKPLPTMVPGVATDEFGLVPIVMAAKGLDILDELTKKLAQDIERIILRPRMVIDNGLVAKITVSSKHLEELSAKGEDADLTIDALFRDLAAILEFFATSLPSPILAPMARDLVPAFASLLEQQWLDPAIPLTMGQMPHFTSTLRYVEALADQMDGYGWEESSVLRDWIQNAPKAWLTKRREAVLGDARNVVFSGLSERKTVERVETRVVAKNDPVIAGSTEDAGEDAWDEEWDESEEKTSAAVASKQDTADDDDVSAWDVEEDPDDKGNALPESQDDDEAWGAWDEEDAPKPSSPVATKKAQQPITTNGAGPQPPAEQELTLRETFTTTAVPEGIFEILQQIISDAETLSGPDFTSSPLAPASQALYTLPTLTLAIYRATAPTAYNKLDVGSLLIYNDSLRLAELLRTWQTSRPSTGGRLRLENDVLALETFAKKAYSTEMESQRTILRDILDGAQGFGNCTVQPFKTEAENAIDGAVARLRDVREMWKGVLSQGALLQSLGSLLSIVTGKIISEVEDLGDISEADSHQLNALCQRITGVTDMFTLTPQDGQQGGGEEQRDMTFIYCPTWLKFQYLAEILESSLADIKWMWKEGELSLEFAPDEVVDLVEALFAESDLRRQAVREIKGGRR